MVRGHRLNGKAAETSSEETWVVNAFSEGLGLEWKISC